MSSSARLAMTSFAFMLVDVPAPPWMTPTRNSLCSAPATISSQTRSITSALACSSTPSSAFARADACFTRASATMRSG